MEIFLTTIDQRENMAGALRAHKTAKKLQQDCGKTVGRRVRLQKDCEKTKVILKQDFSKTTEGLNNIAI